MKNKLTANLALIMTAAIWGLSFVAQRAGMEYIGPFTFNAVRSFLGALSLVPVIFWVKYSKPDTRTPEIKRTQHADLFKAGTLYGVALFTALSIQQYCMQYVAAGKAGFITALYIIFVPIISIFLGEKFPKRVILSIIMAVYGLYLLCYRAECGGFGGYDLLLLAGAFFYGVHILVVNRYSDRVHPVKASALQFFVVGLLSLLPALLLEKIDIACLYACKGPLFFAGIITCGVAYTLQIFGQKYTRPILASLIMCLESVFAVIGGVLILGEVLSQKEILGCVLMILAVIIANTKQEKRF